MPPKRYQDGRGVEEWLLIASKLLVVAGVLTLLGWLWIALRSQGAFGDSFPFDPAGGLTARVDAFVQTLTTLVFGALAVGIGFALRRTADQGVR